MRARRATQGPSIILGNMATRSQTDQCHLCGAPLHLIGNEVRTKSGEPPWQWTGIAYRFVPEPHDCPGPKFPGFEIHGDFLISTAPVKAVLSDG